MANTGGRLTQSLPEFGRNTLTPHINPSEFILLSGIVSLKAHTIQVYQAIHVGPGPGDVRVREPEQA
jgi:hypothetical protein